MPRVITSVEYAEGKSLDVTPEAINKFYVMPVEVHRVGEGENPTLHFEATLKANTEKSEDITLTLKDDKGRTAVAAINENEFANGLVDAIITKHGGIDDVTMLKGAKGMLAGELAYDIWKEEGAIYDSLRIPGFGYIESFGEVVAVVEGISCEEGGQFYGKKGSDITYYDNLGKGHLHFLPEGTDRFLVFDLDIKSSTLPNGEKEFLLDGDKLPAPTNEQPVGALPKARADYESFEDYIEAVNKYIQKHMAKGNDRRVELEDDLIF